MATLKKNTLLQAAAINAETKACKRVFFSAIQENFFPSLPFLMNLFSPTHGLSLKPTVTTFNVNSFVDKFVLNLNGHSYRTDSRASGNKGLPKAGVTSIYDSFVLNRTLVFQMNGSAEMPRLRQAPNRYRAF